MAEPLNLTDPVDPGTPADRLLEAALPPAHAHREGDARMAQRLLAEYPDAARANIWVASMTGETDAVRGFLQHDRSLANGVRTMLDVGWDIDTRNVVWSETPLHRAAFHANLDLVQLLVDRGADLTITDRTYHSTPLGWAQHAEAQGVIDYFRSLT